MRWPIAIALGLLTVVIVDFAFAYIAVHDADTIDPTYAKEAR